MIDLKCPCGCGGYLVKEFEGSHISVKCGKCGVVVTVDLPLDNKVKSVILSK